MSDKVNFFTCKFENFDVRRSVTYNENVNVYRNHQEYEFLILLSEQACFQIEGSYYNMNCGDIALLSRRELHRIEYDTTKPYDRIVVHFNKKILLPYIDGGCNLLNAFDSRVIGTNNIIDGDVAAHYNIMPIIDRIKEDSEDSRCGREIVINCLFIELLAEINRAHEAMRKSGRFSENDGKILQILEYINKNLSLVLTLESISEQFFMSKYHLAHTFKNATGFSVNHYITYKRVAYAEKLISDGLSAGEACIKSGFNDYSNFYKSFVKQTGYSPKLYKKR